MLPTIAGEAERTAVISAIVMAFSADPMARWIYADSAQYLTHFPPFVDAFAGRAFACGSAWQAGESAAAMWLPPGVEPDEEPVLRLIQQTVPAEVQGDLFALLEETGKWHPAEPYWYLPLIGVDPAVQGRGLGSRLLEAALQIVDRDGVPAYLEASNARNLPLYERYGFRLTGTIRAGSSPSLYPMVRPRSG